MKMIWAFFFPPHVIRHDIVLPKLPTHHTQWASHYTQQLYSGRPGDIIHVPSGPSPDYRRWVTAVQG